MGIRQEILEFGTGIRGWVNIMSEEEENGNKRGSG
jgi:hypothetical protein